MFGLSTSQGFGNGKDGVEENCKVEFIQPFCWLYFVPNLLVIQNLETMYLGENHVRVVCEEKLKNVQSRKTSQLDLVTGSRLASRQKWHTCEACKGVEGSRQVLHYRTKPLV